MEITLSLWGKARTPFVRVSIGLATLAIAVVLTIGTTSCSKDESSSQLDTQSTNLPPSIFSDNDSFEKPSYSKLLSHIYGVTNSPVTRTEYERVAYWNTVLSEHPDLPQKVQEIVAGKGARVERTATEVPTSRVVVHSYLGSVEITAERVNVIVTDLDALSLTKLLAYWQTIPDRARQLGIIPSSSTPSGPRVIVLGSEGRIDVKGPGGSDHQTVDIYHNPLVSKLEIDVHSFGRQGETVANAMLEYYGRANQSRGPPESLQSQSKKAKFGLPPPEAATVLVIGKLRELNVEGGTQASEQRVSFEGYMNGFTETETTRQANEYTKAGDAAFAAKSAGFTAEPVRPTERPAESYRPSESTRPSETYRPSEPYRPSGGGYRPASRPMPRPAR